MDVRNVLEKTVKQFGKKTALIFQGKEVSFSQIQEEVFKLANALKKQGIGKGDKIAFYLPNCLEYCYSYLACFCLGAVGVPLDYMLKEEEIISCLSHSETKLLIAKNKPEVSLDVIKKAVPTLKTIVLYQSQEYSGTGPTPTGIFYSDFIHGCDDHLAPVVIQDKDPALIMYTSGTTGKPKGVLLSYRHLNGSPEAMKHFVDLTDKDIKLAAIPFSHIGGFIYLQNCIHFGITLVIMERFNPFEFLENIMRYRVTCFHIVPPMYNAILTLKQIDRFDLSSLRWVVVFGAPSSPEILERFHKYCPNAKLLNGWGMTETCPPNTVTPLNSNKIESVGKPAPHCEIKIFDEHDKEVPTGGIGEIVIRGWIVMDGYYKDPEQTKEILQNGWLHTGDLGRFDKEGFLYILGRKKEMIKVGGQIVYEPEVEAAFYKHPEVAEVAVVGVADKMKGEAVKAYVVLKQGSSLTQEDLRYFAREHLANFKVPQWVELRSELPKNRTGKIDKSLLKQEDLTKAVSIKP